VLALTPQLRVLVATEPADFRQGIDGLARRVRQVLADEPMSGALFVFRNRRGTAIKLLVYDGQGFWLCQKRLSEGRFRHWPSGPPGQVLAPQELTHRGLLHPEIREPAVGRPSARHRKEAAAIPSVPAARMGRLAVDQGFKGQGLGGALLGDALERAGRSEIAAYALVVEAKDEGAAAFYRHHAFIALPDSPLTLFLPLATARRFVHT